MGKFLKYYFLIGFILTTGMAILLHSEGYPIRKTVFIAIFNFLMFLLFALYKKKKQHG